MNQICNQCRVELPEENFSKDSNRKSCLMSRCKECLRKSRGSHKKNINNIKDANEWLKENFPNYEVLKWKNKDKSTFLDKKRNIQFEYVFYRFKDKIKQNPNRTFGSSKKELSEKIKKSFQEKYDGAVCALQVPEFKQKQESATKEKFGFNNIMHNTDYLKSIGAINLFDGKSVREWAEEKDVSYSHFRNVLAYEGFDTAKQLIKGTSNLEAELKVILEELEIEYVYNEYIKDIKARPDFRIDSHNLVIECDGFRWHSDEYIKEKSFHQKRLNLFNSIGYRALFFRQNEILKQKNIVKSIIANKIKKCKKYHGRKTSTFLLLDNKIGKEFLEQNHLMGNGSGRIYGLSYQGDLLAAIQIKGRKNGQLEISRFTTKNNTSIVGGFSKLLKYVIQTERPNSIITFIDKRYGDGSYLKNLGFEKINENLSFVWTDCRQTFHRLRFPGNSGYDHGLAKIWDCGQAKWQLNCS